MFFCRMGIWNTCMYNQTHYLPLTVALVAFVNPSCPADDTFLWLSVNGLAASSRFSIQMFNMPKGLPLYFHCLANICGPEENCTKVN